MSKRHEMRNEKIENALREALNVATLDAPDGESWTAGWNAFYQDHHDTLDGQLEHALDAATLDAPDGESWMAGWDKFHELYHESASGFLVEKLRSIPSYFKRK